MFTGIITHRGRFAGYRRGREELLVEAHGLAGKLGPGDSLAVNGVCLTLIKAEKDVLRFNLSQETLSRSNLGGLSPRDLLNLEMPLTLASPLSGHLITGHVDAIGKILRAIERRPGRRLTLSFPPEIRPLLVAKGSVAVNGVSLTVASLRPSSMEVELIPLTMEETNLGALKPGSAVNIECDILGKYVYNWLLGEGKMGR